MVAVTMKHNDYRRQMRISFIVYQRARYPLEDDLFDPRREYVKPEYVFCNLF